MFLQAGGGGKGIRPIQQNQQQQASQQQSQQHQNQIPSHHQQQQQQQAIITSSNLQTHHLSSQSSNQQLHHGHHHQPQQQQHQQQQHHQQQHHQQQQHQQSLQQQQSSVHLGNIQAPLLPQPHHQQATLQHPPPHHHTPLPYYTYQLSQAAQPQPLQPPTHPSHHHQQQQHLQQQQHPQQQQIANNGANAAQPLVITPGSTSSGNVSSSSSAINSNNSNNNNSNNAGQLLRQHTATAANNIQTMYTPNAAGLLQSPTANPGFMTPYMQQYPIQTAVIAAAAAAAQYPTNQPNNGGAVGGGGGGVGSNNHNANGHNNQNNGPQPPPPQSAAAVYQMAQQTHQQQPLMQYFHPSAAGVTGGPPPTAPPHLHPNQPQFRSVLTSGHAQHHNAPPAYLLSAPTTTLYAMPPGQLTAGPAQRASLLPAPGQPTNGAANGNIPMSQLMQAASTPTGATTFMPAAFCTAPIGMTHGPLAGTAPLMTSGAALGPSPLQTYSHLTISSSNTSMSSLSEGNIKPRPHAIPIIDPITHENILDPKPLHKSASVEVKPSAPEFSKNNGETDSMTSSTTSVPSKWRDKSITVSIPPSKSSTSTTGPSISSNSIAAAAAEKIDQQMQTDVKREKHPMSIIKIEDPNVVGERQREITKSKSRDHQEGDAATNWQAEIKAHFPKKSSVGDTDDSSMKDADDDDEKLIIVMEEKKTYVFTRSPKYDQSTGLNILDDEQSNVASTLRGGEHYEGLENENFFEEKIGSNESIDTLKTAVKTQKIIHDKGQQAFIPKNSEQLPAAAAAAAGGEELVGDASYMKLQATQSNEQNLMITAVYDASTALSSTQSNSSTSSKVVNGRRQNSTGGGGGNKQNTSASASAATSSCSSINSSSATHLVDESNVLLLNCQEDAAAAVAKPHPIQSAATTSTKIFQNQSLQQQQQPQQVLKRQTQQSFQQQQQQQPMKNTPTTSGASSSTASTPTHQSHHASTDTSITPTPGNNNSKRRRNKRLKEQKKKSETTTNRNQQQQQSQQQQQQQTQQTQKQHQQQQQQQQASSVRHNSNTNLYNNNNNNNNNSNNAGGSCNSNTSNTNNNKNNRKNSSNSLNNNYNNNNTMTTTVTSTSTAAACAPAKTTPTTTTTNQTDNNNSNTYKSTSCTNVNISSSNGNTFKKNSSSQNSKQHQQHQQQQQQQQYHQHRFNSNNSNNSNSNRSRRSITFGALGSDAGSSISDADSKASIVSYNREINLVDMRCNFSNESTSSSTHLTSPKKNHRHIRAREIVEQYLTTSTGGDNYSDKTNGSDETPIQFLNSSSSACEDDDETNAQLEFRKQQLKLGEHQQLDKYQQPLEFGIGAMALSDIDEVYFGDFTESDYTNRSTKTDDDIELDITITKIFESQKLKKPMAETIDCLPMRATTSISKDYGNATASAAAHGSKKAATHKGNEKVSASTSYSNRQQPMTICGEAAGGQAAAHQQPPAATSPPSPPSRPKFFRYSFRDLKELANAPESCKPPMIRCQKDNCVSQLFVARQQHHLASSHQAHSSLSSMTLQHLQTYQQISYNESMEFVSGKRRGGGGGGGSGGGGGGSASERMKKHEHLSSGGMPMGGGGGGAGGMGNNIGMMGLMSGGSGSGNSSQQQRKMDIIRVHLSLKEEIKLSECENAWTPDTLRGKSTQRTSSSTLNDDLEAVLKKVRGVLNKLTPNNFDVLLKTMTSISMNTQEKMQQVMLLIFEKTVSEPNFAPTYAKFCKVLFQEIKAESKSLFSTLLITRIQHEFETNVNDADAKHKKLQPLVDRLAACTDPKERIELQAELEDQEYQFRRRAWGTVRFIGEMYKLQSLTSDRVLICIESLLRHGSEEKLEFMCKLLTTVGYLLEAATPEQVQHMTRIDDIFRRMQEIVQRSRGGGGGQNQAQNQAKISSRVRFMMQDVMDLRARHWDQGPRTGNAAGGSNQSSAGGSSSQQQQQQQQQQMHQQRRKDDKSHGNSGGGMGSSNVHEKQQSRGYSSSVGSSQSAHRQLRSGGGSGGGGGENTHYFMQKNSKQYSQQHQQQHQQPEQKVNIDVNKLKFTRGDEVTTSTTKLGSPSLYLWRTAGRQSASNSSLTTSGSASSTQQQSATVLGAQPSSSSSIASGSGAAGNSNKRQTSNPFEVLDCISPTAAQQQAQAAMSSDGDDTFTDDTEDQTQMGGSGSNNLKYSGKECQQLLDRLVEEVFDVSSANSSWQDEALTIWCNASTKQQVTLLHYLLMDYLHLVSVKRQQREACAKIFKHLLITPEIFNKIVFDEAYAQFSEEFPDLLVDVPDGWVYVFEFIGPILHDDLIRFEDIWQPMWAEDRNFTERFLKAFLNYFTHEYGANYTRDMWHRRYQLDHGQQFLMDEQRWQQFVANNRYDYLLETKSTENKETGQEAECVVRTVPITVKRSMQQQGGGSSSNSSSRQQQEELDASKHIERIGSLLRQKNGSADLAMEYIISSVPINNEFLRGITELFCCDIATSVNDAAASNNSNNAAAISEKERLKGGKTTSAQRRSFEIDIFRKKCLPILRLCVDSNESLELSCLDAIFEILLDNYEEAKANKMICNVFDLFYDTELIPKATFEKWYQTQSLVDDAIEAAGTAAGTTTTVTVTETQNTKSSSSTKSSNKKHQGSQKKQHKQQQQQQQQSIQSQQRQPSPPSSSSSSSNSAAAAAADNNNNPHKISAELHAYMRKLLVKIWCKTPAPPSDKQIVQ